MQLIQQPSKPAPEGVPFAGMQWRTADGAAFVSIGPKYISPGVFEWDPYVSGGFTTEARARTFATAALAVLREHGFTPPVFIVRGPTSTTRHAFEVCSASAGYSILARFN